MRLSTLAIVCVVLAGVAVGAVGNGLLAAGMRRVGTLSGARELLPWLGRILREPRIAAGLALQGVFVASYLLALANAELSFVFPITALDHALTPLVALVALGERPPLQRWLGIALIVAGVGLVVATRGAPGKMLQD